MTEHTSPAAHAETRDLSIGALAFVEHTGISSGSGRVTSRGLEDGLALFELIEDLGYDTGYVRSRHLQPFLSAPLPFLAAAGQRVRRLGLGTQVIPLRFEHAGRLAEEIATTDLLTQGRLQIGVSSGYSAQDAVNVRAFGEPHGTVREHVDRTLHDLLCFLDGETVAMADTHMETIASGSPLRLQPQVPGLRERLSYGAATVRSAELAGSLGLGMRLSTMHPDDGSGRSFEESQAELIGIYRQASRDAGYGEGRVSVGRLVFPVHDDADLEAFDGILTEDAWNQRAHADGAEVTEIGGQAAVFGRVHADDPETVARSLAEDVALQAADELVICLPMDRPLELVRRIASTFAQEVAPLLRRA